MLRVLAAFWQFQSADSGKLVPRLPSSPELNVNKMNIITTKILRENVNNKSLSAVQSGRKSSLVDKTVLLSFEEKNRWRSRMRIIRTLSLSCEVRYFLVEIIAEEQEEKTPKKPCFNKR